MKMPNAEQAVVELTRLTGYCLNPGHPRGRHKARVFTARLGLTAEHAELLQTALLAAAREKEALAEEKDDFGQRYVVDFEMEGPSGPAMVRSRWVVRTGEGFPRLTTCYVL